MVSRLHCTLPHISVFKPFFGFPDVRSNMVTSSSVLRMSFYGGGFWGLSKRYNAFQPCNSSTDGDKTVCLNDTQWDALYNMANNSGSAFLFGFSFDFVKACRDKGSYVWQPDAAVAMIKHIQRKGQAMWGYVLSPAF